MRGPARYLQTVDIRAAEADDYPAFAALFPELESGDPTPKLQKWSDEIAPQTVLAVVGQEVLGYLFYQRLHDDIYVRHLVVAPGARRAGAGRALLGWLRAHKGRARRWRLNVKPGNVPAVALYRSVGMEVAHWSLALRLSFEQWSTFPEPARGVVSGLLDPELDAAAERALGLPEGQVAHARASRRVVVGVIDGAEVVGLALFDPGFPGAFPFRARTPAHARALAEGTRPHVREDDLQFVVEGDEALRAASLAAGAVIRMETWHMEGPI